MSQEIKPGDLISFDVPGVSKSPYGFGTVRKVNGPDSYNIQPHASLAPGMRMINIKKAG